MNPPKDSPYTREATLDEWKNARKKELSGSMLMTLQMKKGQVLMVIHPDVFCDGSTCSLRSALSKRKEGKWRFRHTGPGEAFIYREK